MCAYETIFLSDHIVFKAGAPPHVAKTKRAGGQFIEGVRSIAYPADIVPITYVIGMHGTTGVTRQ